MTVDSHNHLGGPDKGDKKAQSAEELIAKMDEAGVDMAVVFPFNEKDPGVSFSRCNDYIAEAVSRFPGRLIGFCRLDPNAGGAAVAELNRCVNELGLKGIKLHPTGQGFSLSHPVLAEIMEAARELEVPALFDTGKKQSPPSGVADLAARFPGLKVIMAHMNLCEESVEAARNNPDVFLGTTGYFNLKRLGRAIRELGAGRFVAGSDSPYISIKSEMGKFSLIPELSEDERRRIAGRNFLDIIGAKPGF